MSVGDGFFSPKPQAALRLLSSCYSGKQNKTAKLRLHFNTGVSLGTSSIGKKPKPCRLLFNDSMVKFDAAFTTGIETATLLWQLIDTHFLQIVEILLQLLLCGSPPPLSFPNKTSDSPYKLLYMF